MKKGNISIFVPHLGCPSDCSFCNQKTITGQCCQPTGQDVKNAVETALKYKDFEYEIAFFGGSFTAIKREYMIELLSAAYEYVRRGKVKGIRVSTRPDAIDEDVLKILFEYGVTSIELGAQSMVENVLELNKRGHSAKSVVTASKMIKDAGFSLGLQMMTGLYGDDDNGAVYTASEFIKIKPDTVRIYPTVILKGTLLEKYFNEGIYKGQSVDEAVEICAKLVPMFEKNGIKVIRVGLHASEDVKNSMVAGAYHEAMGELVTSKILYNKICKLEKGKYTVYVNNKTYPKLIGQRRSNISLLNSNGYELKIIRDETVKDNDLRFNNGFKNS